MFYTMFYFAYFSVVLQNRKIFYMKLKVQLLLWIYRSSRPEVFCKNGFFYIYFFTFIYSDA